MALTLLTAFRRNPWLHNRVRVPLRDFVRFMGAGLRYGWALRNIYRDYQEPGIESR